MADPPGLAAYLRALRQHESGSDYTARGRPGRTASGAYQYIDGTWGGYGGYAHASDAPRSVQDARARQDAIASYQRYGSWDLAATAHFTGHAVRPGTAEYTARPAGPSSNPTPAEYVASIRRLMGSPDGDNVTEAPARTSRSSGGRGGSNLAHQGFTSSEKQMGGFDDGIGKKTTPGTESAGSVTAAGPNINLDNSNWWELPAIGKPQFADSLIYGGNHGGRSLDEAFDPGHGGGGVLGREVSRIGKQYVGVPYVWGGTSPTGMDCSGLVQLVFKQVGIDLPRLSADQARSGPQFNPAFARAGDLIAWDNSTRNNGADHIAISLGNGYILEAPRTGLNVRVRKLTGEDLREAWAVRVKGNVDSSLLGKPPPLAAASGHVAQTAPRPKNAAPVKVGPAKWHAHTPARGSGTAVSKAVGGAAASVAKTAVKAAAKVPAKKVTPRPSIGSAVSKSVGSAAANLAKTAVKTAAATPRKPVAITSERQAAAKKPASKASKWATPHGGA